MDSPTPDPECYDPTKRAMRSRAVRWGAAVAGIVYLLVGTMIELYSYVLEPGLATAVSQWAGVGAAAGVVTFIVMRRHL